MSTIREDGGTIKSGIGGDTSGTVHASGSDISSGFGATPSGTVNAGADISSGMHGPSHGSSAMSLNPGDTLVVKSVTYRYESVISKSSGEAEIYLLSRDGVKRVFKLYYPNFKPKDDILKQLALLNHEDIINVLDYGFHHDRFFEIMEYAEGGTLEQYLPIKDSGRIKQIVKETVNAYLYCHNHNIIHKDIKPQNLYFRNADGSDLLIGDFGISSLLESGMSRHLTSQSLTVGYAAPEMYGLGGKVYVGKEVDYYALGITLIHLWEGKSPFDGLDIHAISNLTTSGKINIPDDMPKDIQKLVKGLITVDYTKRWAYDEVQRWLRGEDVPVHFHVKEITYPPYQHSANGSATTTEELATFLENNPDKGKKQLYSNKISAWVNLFNQGLSAELDRIIEDDYPRDQDAGIQKAIYILDPDKPYVKYGLGVPARSAEELGDALEESFDSYTTELSNPNHPFYLYLEAHEAKKEADTFRKYFKTFSANKALNTIILELHGRDKVRISKVNYFSPEELLDADTNTIIKMLKDPESRVSMWLEGTEWKEIKSQVAKWLSLGVYDDVTLTFALEQGSPFHFPSGQLAYTLSEFDILFIAELCEKTADEAEMALKETLTEFEALYISQHVNTNFLNKAVNPSSGFVRSATYWLDKYASGTTYESRLKIIIDAFATVSISGQLLEFFSTKLNKDYYLSDIATIIETNYDNGDVDDGLLDKHHKIIEKLVNANPNDTQLISYIENKLNSRPTDPISGQLLEFFVNTGINQTTYINTITPLVERSYKNKIITDTVLNKHYDVLKQMLKNEYNSKLFANYILLNINEDIAVTLIREYLSGNASIQIYLTEITPLVEALYFANRLNDSDLKAHHGIIKKLQQQNINNSLITDYIKANVKTGLAEELLTDYLYSNVQISHYINVVAPIIETNFTDKPLAQMHYDFLLTKLIEDPVNDVYIDYIIIHWGKSIATSMLLEYCNCNISRDYFEKHIEPMLEKANKEKIIDTIEYRKVKLRHIKIIEAEVKASSPANVQSKLTQLQQYLPGHPLIAYVNENAKSPIVQMNDNGKSTILHDAVKEYYAKPRSDKWEQRVLDGKKLKKPMNKWTVYYVVIICVMLSGYIGYRLYVIDKLSKSVVSQKTIWDDFLRSNDIYGICKAGSYSYCNSKYTGFRNKTKVRVVGVDVNYSATILNTSDSLNTRFIIEYNNSKCEINSDKISLNDYPPALNNLFVVPNETSNTQTATPAPVSTSIPVSDSKPLSKWKGVKVLSEVGVLKLHIEKSKGETGWLKLGSRHQLVYPDEGPFEIVFADGVTLPPSKARDTPMKFKFKSIVSHPIDIDLTVR